MTGVESDISTRPSDSTGGLAAIRRSLPFVLLCVVSATTVGILIAYASDDKSYGRYRPWISEKLAVLASRPPVPNAIFIGASITLTTIIPEEVDAAAGDAGCRDIHSINLGIPSAQIFENAFMLDRVLKTPDLRPGSLVIYDAVSIEQFDFERIAKSDRTPVSLRFRYVPDLFSVTNLSWNDGLRLLTYIRAVLGEALGFHALSDVAMQPWRQKGGFKNTRVLTRGYTSVESGGGSRQRGRFLQKLAEHKSNLRNWSIASFEGQELSYNPFAERIRKAGFVPIAYVGPYPDASLAAAILGAQAVDPTLQAISITKENAPEIYAGSRLWIDRTHVTEVGAKIVSSIVGHALCSIIKGS